MRNALIVVDLQRGFDDPRWGRRNNPACERNVAALIAGWRQAGESVVFTRHDSRNPDSPLRPGHPGNELRDVADGKPDLLVAKQVNSAFHGDPDLAAWLRGHAIERLTVCGVQTNFCCETTARVGSNLGFDVRFAIDATHTFDLPGPDGRPISAEDLSRTTHANLDPEFCRVLDTATALAGLDGAG